MSNRQNQLMNAVIDDVVLMCPCCEGGYLHQSDVMVFNPDGEYCNTAHVYYDGGTRTQRVPPDMSMNPSRERQGMIVTFDCETGCTPRLNIYQHKGCTLVEWDVTNAEAKET